MRRSNWTYTIPSQPKVFRGKGPSTVDDPFQLGVGEIECLLVSVRRIMYGDIAGSKERLGYKLLHRSS